MELQEAGLGRSDHRRQAVDLFNFTWTLLNAPARTPEDDDAMVHAAHASAYHWLIAGDATNHARSHWQCSRVYAVLGRGEPALHHADRCLAICGAGSLSPFDHACAHEARGRSLAVLGERDACARALAEARRIGNALEDEEERDAVLPFCDEIEEGL